jgi:hypothetical protein
MNLQHIEECARRSPWLIDGGHLEDDRIVMLHGLWLGVGNMVLDLAPDGSWSVVFNMLDQPLHGLINPPANLA